MLGLIIVGDLPTVAAVCYKERRPEC